MTPPATATSPALADLYEADETAWLETSSRLILAGRVEELDYANLAEFLDSMAKRDRREAANRLKILITHLLKWQYQVSHRSRSWELTITTQRDDLEFDLQSKTLRNHVEAELPATYRKAVLMAVIETGLGETSFPNDCPFTLEQILTESLRS